MFSYRYFSSCIKIIDIFTHIISPRRFKCVYLQELEMFSILIDIYSTPFLILIFLYVSFSAYTRVCDNVSFYFVHVCISVSSSGVCTRWCAKIVICTKMHLVHADLQTKSFVVVHTWFICTEIPIVNMNISISVWMQTPSNIIYLILIKFSEVDLKSSRIKLYFFFKASLSVLRRTAICHFVHIYVWTLLRVSVRFIDVVELASKTSFVRKLS